MKTSLPAVQKIKSYARGYYKPKTMKVLKRIANRRHRHALNEATRSMIDDIVKFDDEGFNAPSLSSWDLV